MPAAAPPFPKPVKHPGTYPGDAPPSARATTLTVWSPEGVKEVHSTLNARDLVRSRGYTLRSPRGAVEVTKSDGDDAVVAAGDYAETEAHANAAMEALTALRKQAEDLGVVVDNRWGTKRLNEEIAAKKGA